MLAAGYGVRLRPLTDRTPKAMVRVDGVPVLERNVRWLRSQGIRELAVNLHHLPDVPMQHFGDGLSYGVSIRWSPESELLGTAGALLPLADFLGGDRFAVVYGDNIIECDVTAVAAEHERLSALVTVALWERDDASASGVAELDDDGRIVRLLEKPAPGATESRLVNAGFMLCEPRLLDFVKPGLDFGADVLPSLIAAGEVVAGYRMGSHERLAWIDTPEDLLQTEAALREGVARR